MSHRSAFRARRGRWRSAARPLPVLALVLGVSCASYPARTEAAFSAFERGQLSQAFDAYRERKTTGSEFLSGVEAGTVALADGRWDASITQLDRAIAVAQDVEREALASTANLEDWLLSWTLNEGSQRYVGEGYERALVHALSSVARLAKGDFEGARVESRRANALLESEEKLYSKEYVAGGLGHFVSALVYELDGKPDDAWIDYQRMRSKGVGMGLAGHALVRLAPRVGREDEVADLAREFGAESVASDSASIVIVAGVGLGPYKREITLPIPTPDGILQWSVPAYERRAQPVGDLELSVAGGDRAVRTVVIEDVGRVAKENLDDRLVLLAAKSAVRAVLKRELTQKLQKDAGILGRIAGDVFAVLTERADLRCWQTLPDTWQAARVFVPPGTHTIDLEARGGERRCLGRFEVEPRETLFVVARTVGTRLYAHAIGGRRVEGEGDVPAPTPTAAAGTPR